MTKKPKRSRKSGKPKGLKRHVTVIAAAVTLLAILAVVDYYRTFLRPNVAECNKDGVIVRIEHDFTYADLVRVMTDSTVLDNPKTFLRAARFYSLDRDFRPGNYFLSADMDNKSIVRTIALGLQKPVNFVFNGYVSDMHRLAQIFSAQIDADSTDIVRLLTDSATIVDFGFTPETFPAMFIPNTYEVYWTISPENLLRRLHHEYEKFWDSTRMAKANEIGLTPVEVSTLASIVIEETKYSSELPIVAGVYMNRLRRGMALQADPTVRYVVGPEVTRVLHSHLQIESPYNTYKHTGLPPGPITIAPIKAIDAVLNYQRHNYIYFCANPSFDGRHSFATNFIEHQANAAAYRAAYVQWRREKTEAALRAADSVAESKAQNNGRTDD